MEGEREESLGPLLLLDTAGCDMDEQAEEGSGSKYNDGEAQVCLRHRRCRSREAGSHPPCPVLTWLRM